MNKKNWDLSFLDKEMLRGPSVEFNVKWNAAKSDLFNRPSDMKKSVSAPRGNIVRCRFLRDGSLKTFSPQPSQPPIVESVKKMNPEKRASHITIYHEDPEESRHRAPKPKPVPLLVPSLKPHAECYDPNSLMSYERLMEMRRIYEYDDQEDARSFQRNAPRDREPMYVSGKESIPIDYSSFCESVVIVVPPNWDTLACGKSLPVGSFTSRSAVNDAAIRIGTEHPIFGHLPWTQQSRGCGLPGDFISVGYHYVQQFNDTENTIGHSGSNANDNNEDIGGGGSNYGRSYGNTGYSGSSSIKSGYNSVPTERAFVREWAKFRYGVFEEIGFANDPIYPVSYMENRERKATACTNTPIRGNWSIGCDESTGSGGNSNGYYSFPYFTNGNNNGGSQHHRSSNNNNVSCFFTPMTSTNSHENDHITSSIMSFAQLKNAKLFCDSKTHNTKAPTKQNFLCEQKSTSDVIFAHPDFRDLPFREPNVPVPPPEFIVKQITQPRFVLLVEETGNMNLRDVWKFLKLAIRKFIKYDIPIGSQIGLITINTNDVRVLANMTSLQNPILRRALADKLPNYPNVDSGGNISLRRGIIQAVEILKRNQQRAAGSVIILVSQGTVSNTDLEASLELLRQEEVTVAAIEYPSLGRMEIS